MPLTRKEISQRQRDRKLSSGLREVRHLFVPSKNHDAYRDDLKALVTAMRDNKDYKWEAKK